MEVELLHAWISCMPGRFIKMHAREGTTRWAMAAVTSILNIAVIGGLFSWKKRATPARADLTQRADLTHVRDLVSTGDAGTV